MDLFYNKGSKLNLIVKYNAEFASDHLNPDNNQQFRSVHKPFISWFLVEYPNETQGHFFTCVIWA